MQASAPKTVRLELHASSEGRRNKLALSQPQTSSKPVRGASLIGMYPTTAIDLRIFWPTPQQSMLASVALVAHAGALLETLRWIVVHPLI